MAGAREFAGALGTEQQAGPQRWHRQHPDWSIMWTGGRALDRAAALEKWGPPPERQRSKREKSRGRVGRPPDYQGEIIQQIARDYIASYGLPATQARLRDEVADECERRDITVPENTRFKELIGPIYRAASRQGR